MKVELNTGLLPIFSGTYESFWEVEEFDDNGDELHVDYKLDDLMKSIVAVYKNHEDFIKTELDIDFINSIKFTGETTSPREYNFATDRLFFEVDYNVSKLKAKLKELENDQEFAKFLYKNYTSRDGFWSYTPNNYADLKRNILYKGDEYEQAFGALCTYLALDVLKQDYSSGIEGQINESWRGNGYGGLDYTIEEV